MPFSQTSPRDWQPGCLFKPVPTVPCNWNLWLSGLLKYDLTYRSPFDQKLPSQDWAVLPLNETVFLTGIRELSLWVKNQVSGFSVWYHNCHTVPQIIYAFCFVSFKNSPTVGWHSFLNDIWWLALYCKNLHGVFNFTSLYSGYSKIKKKKKTDKLQTT